MRLLKRLLFVLIGPLSLTLVSCAELQTKINDACHAVDTQIDQSGISWENAKATASIDKVVADCVPLKNGDTYSLLVTAKVSTKIDDAYAVSVYGPLTDAVRFEALSTNGAVIAHDKVSYKVPRLLRAENVSVAFRGLAASEIKHIGKIVVGWSFE
jgi:hypothetical protein